MAETTTRQNKRRIQIGRESEAIEFKIQIPL